MSNDNALALRGELNAVRAAFESMLVDNSVSFEREAGFAMQALTASDFMLKTAMMNPQSVRNAVTNIAAIGISLNPARKQAYLVPRDGKICLDISYMGLLDIAIDSGAIRWGQAELVYAKDRFLLNGVDKQPLHERDPFAEDRGEIVGAYVVVKTADGDYLTTAMPVGEILAIRDRSQSWKSGKSSPWKTDAGEMMKKTVIKRAYKTWPKTEKSERIGAAVDYLNNEAGEGFERIDNEPVNQPANFGVTAARAKVIRMAANAALQKFNEGNEYGAFEEVCDIIDNEEKLALWSILKPHSALRSSLKRHAEEQRKREAELASGEVVGEAQETQS